MNPEETLRQLARNLVNGQQAIATLERTAATLRGAGSAITPEIAQQLAEVEATVRQWHTEALPSLAASMKLACEVYDTFGPGPTTVDDPVDAAIWNNKYFAWQREFGGATTP